MGGAEVAPQKELMTPQETIAHLHFNPPKRHWVFWLLHYCTLNSVVEQLVWNGEIDKLCKSYEVLGVVSALIASFGVTMVLALPASLPPDAAAGLTTWFIVSAFGSLGLATINILNCAIILNAVGACPNPLELIHDIPLMGVPFLCLVVNMLFLMSYLAAFLSLFLPSFVVPIMCWFSAFLALLLAVTVWVHAVYLPARISGHHARTQAGKSSAGSRSSSQ